MRKCLNCNGNIEKKNECFCNRCNGRKGGKIDALCVYCKLYFLDDVRECDGNIELFKEYVVRRWGVCPECRTKFERAVNERIAKQLAREENFRKAYFVLRRIMKVASELEREKIEAESEEKIIF